MVTEADSDRGGDSGPDTDQPVPPGPERRSTPGAGDTPDIDPDQLKLFSFQVWTYKMGEVVSVLIHLGDRLGIYKAMSGAGPMTSHDVAEATGLHERFVREWLFGQAAARLLDRHSDGTFELNPVQSAVLAEEETSLAFSAGAFRGGLDESLVDALAESFRTGVGVTYEQQGPKAAAGMARMTAPFSRLALTDRILPALDGVTEKLRDGGSVADIGCGGGVALCAIAKAFPASHCVGYDPSPSAIEVAREYAASEGVTNVEFRVAGAEHLEATDEFDLVLTFDCLHDMPRPDLAMKTVHAALKPGGTWLIKDIRSSGDFESDLRNPMLALFYGFSVLSCLQSSMSTHDGHGLGTLGLHPEKAREMVSEAGFTSFRIHDFDDNANLYYEVRH